VARREIATGLALGLILGGIGLVRILLWRATGGIPGEAYLQLGVTVSLSLVGVVLWGSVVGSMLPFVLRRAGFDPATASAPLVATLVDVTGVVIYFTLASVLLRGTLL
jgi:magnesium transporter